MRYMTDDDKVFESFYEAKKHEQIIRANLKMKKENKSSNKIDASQLKTTRQIVEAFPDLIKLSTLHYYSKHRDENGLTEGGVCFKGPRKGLLWHEKRFIDWLLGK